MSTLKQWSGREFQKILRNNGYEPMRTCGSHVIYKNTYGNTISVPKGEPNKMLTRRLIKENNLVH